MSHTTAMSAKSLGQIRSGASIWTIFRYLSQLLYAVCWIIALPVELLLNRRMGRRYTGLLPAICSFTLLAVFLMFKPSPAPKGRAPQSLAIELSSMWLILSTLSVVTAVLLAQRVASWLRFRSADQIYSFASGIPVWLYWPNFVTRCLPVPGPGHEEIPPVLGDRHHLVRQFIRHVRHQIAELVREIRLGQVPTGPVYWIAATILHPLALMILGSIIGAWLHGPIGWYIVLGGLAIFVKARIQKAMVIENIYDLFDARIEHEFTRSLVTPEAATAVERTGFGIPGLARTVTQAGITPSQAAALDPDLADLLVPSGARTNPKSVEPVGAGIGAVEP